jgi:Ca2+-binding EF-hand superfamily protein
MMCDLHFNKIVGKKTKNSSDPGDTLPTTWQFRALQIKGTKSRFECLCAQGRIINEGFLKMRSFCPKILERNNTLHTLGNP